MPSGYSGTPLLQKLGIHADHKISIINAPENYFQLLQMPVQLTDSSGGDKFDFIHCFVKEESELKRILPKIKKELEQDGMIWISWYKKSAKMNTDVTEDAIRNLALSIGLVDVKVCAIDEQWSGLKLVIPLKDRTGK